MPRPSQIKLSGLFVLILLISLPLGCIAYLKRQTEDFNRVAAPFEKVTGRRPQASGDGMAIVYGRYGLTQLNLVDADLDDAKLLKLKGDLERLPNLRSLVLNRTTISDVGLEALENLQTLDGLYLSGTSVSDVAVERLKRLHGLTRLGLQGTQVTDAGVEELRRALPNCEIDH